MQIAVNTDTMDAAAQRAADGVDGIKNATPDIHFSSLASLMPGSVTGGSGAAVARRVNVIKADLVQLANGYATGLDTSSKAYAETENVATHDFSLSYSPSTASKTTTAQSSSGYQAGNFG